MKIKITGKQLKVIPRLRKHVEEHMEKLSRYDSGILSTEVILKIQKFTNVAEVMVHISRHNFFGEGRTDDNLFSAVDLAINRVEAQMKKHRDKLKSHKKNNRRTAGRLKQAEEVPEVVGAEFFSPEPLSVDEASLQLDASEKDFIIFKNSKTKKMSVMYKRDDGHHSVVEHDI